MNTNTIDKLAITAGRNALRDRIKGAVVAAVTLDAYGSPRQFKQRLRSPCEAPVYMEKCDTFGLGAGYFTDDGSQILCGMDSFVRSGGKFDLHDFAHTLVLWLDEGYLSSIDGRAFDVGGATAAALNHYSKSGGTQFLGPRENALGNGSLMRSVVPSVIGIMTEDYSVPLSASDVTHNAVKVREAIKTFTEVLRQHLLTGRKTDIGKEFMSKYDFTTVPNSGCVTTSLEAALWALHTYDDIKDGARALCAASGDSDTICSIYGALAGALCGYEALPMYLVNKVQKIEFVTELTDKFVDALGLGEAKEGK